MQPIFSRNKDIDKIAFLNWRIEKGSDILNLLNMAEGFMLAAIRLAKDSLKNNRDKTADIVIFPVLTNANHGIELYLKAMTWILNILMADDKRIEGGHNIKQIYATVRAKIKAHHGNTRLKDFDEATANLDAYIQELFDKTSATEKKDKMDFTRYPFDQKYDDHFYVEQLGNVEIDLENFVKRFEDIKQNLENISDFMYHLELNEDW